MKMLLTCLLFGVFINSVTPQQETTPIPILKFNIDGPNYDGKYSWEFETGNEITAEESGYVKNLGEGEGKEAQVAEGKFGYVAPDGTVISMSYVADENGFQPQGDHLPTPPPIPPAILKALEYIRSMPPALNEVELGRLQAKPVEKRNDVQQRKFLRRIVGK